MLKRWTRISLVVLGLVALIALAHRMADLAATRQLEEALARLDAAARPDEVTEAKSDETSPLFEGLARAIDACETALGPDRFELMTRVDDDADPPAIEELVSIVADSRAAFDLLDAALANADGRLPLDFHHRTRPGYADLLSLARLCRADVRVRLHANEFDAAAKSVRRISALADTLENGPTLIAHLFRLTLIDQACLTARSLLERAPNPAALPDYAPRSPTGAIRAGWVGEARLLRNVIASALRDEFDASSIEVDHSDPSLELLSIFDPWLKSSLVEMTDHLLAIRNHLHPTSENVTRLHELEQAIQTDGNRFVRAFVTRFSNHLEVEITVHASLDVLRAGAMAWAQFRERGAWPATESFGTEVIATRVDGDLELRSAVDPSVTWKLVAPRQSEEARAR